MIAGDDDLEGFWDDLLAYIEDHRVVPVIGPDLLEVQVDGQPRPLYEVLAQRLAARLRVPMAEIAGTGAAHGPDGRNNSNDPNALNALACAFLQRRGRREDLYLKLNAVMKELVVEPPAALLSLARVTGFDLFVTLSFDSLMAQALDRVRFGGTARTTQLAYAPHKVADLPAERAALPGPLVYSLFGKLSVGPDYVVADEDMLEFLCALQTDARRPPLLFDALHDSHLLFLGCRFPDWLARFFIRIAKGRQLSLQRGESELLVDPRLHSDADLVLFLEHFSYGTQMVAMEPRQFAAELERRWLERHPAQPAAGPATLAAAPAALAAELPPGGIFLSYAKEDFAAAQALHDALEAAGLDVWLDSRRLEAGDLYDQQIRRGVKACALFVPLVSATTERRLEGYFRREWRWAEERSQAIAPSVPFILPVVLDDTPPYGASVPEAFLQAQWTALPGGQGTPEFTARVVKLVRDYRRRERGLDAASA
jgi:hypothetical protein